MSLKKCPLCASGAETDHPDGIIEDIAYDREFSPLNFTYTLTNNVNVAFSWTVMTGVSDYTLTLSYTDGDGGVYDQVDLIAPLGGDGATVTTMDYTFKELPGNCAWKAELVAVSQRAGVADSKPAVCTFATGVENLFLNDGKVSDDDITATTALLRWVAGSNVTALNVTPGVGTVSLSAEQIAAGECELTGLTTGTAYTVELLRDDAVRGIVTFVASDKIDVDVIDKSASTITLSWGADRQVTGLVLKGGDDERNITLTQEQIAAHTYTFEGLKERTEYSISVYIDGVESGNLVVTTLGQSNFWDFTDASKWPIANWDSNQTIDGLTILAASGKNVQVQADADYGCNYLDLRGKSTVKEGEAPTQRAVQFSVVGEGVIAIDCYANGAGRNFYAYVDALGKAFGPFEAPTAANRGKVYIPCPGIPASAVVSIWTDATINHIYSIGWYEGTEAPGQNATPLAAPAVTASPAEVTKGDSTPVTFSWAAVPNAATYTYRLALTKLVGETEEVVRLSETVSTTEMTVPAETVAELKPGTYTISVTAAAASDFLYKPSPAGSAVLTVNDTKLATPVVKLDPAKVTEGEQKEVVASWDAVEGAASYAVTFNNGTSETVNTTSHTIAAAEVAALAVGEYTISVVATPADASAQASDPGTAKLTVANGTQTDYTMTLSAKAGVLSSNITGLPTSWGANDSTWTATDDTGASTITFTGNIYYSTDAAKNVVWYFNKGKTETHVSASDLGKIRKITIMPNSTREPDYLKCTYNGGTVLAATEPLGVKTATITFDFADVSADDFRIDYVLDWTSSVSNVEIGKVVIEYTK